MFWWGCFMKNIIWQVVTGSVQIVAVYSGFCDLRWQLRGRVKGDALKNVERRHLIEATKRIVNKVSVRSAMKFESFLKLFAYELRMWTSNICNRLLILRYVWYTPVFGNHGLGGEVKMTMIQSRSWVQFVWPHPTGPTKRLTQPIPTQLPEIFPDPTRPDQSY